MCAIMGSRIGGSSSSVASISSVSSSAGSICDLWGVAYPSDFIPGGGNYWFQQHHHHRLHQKLPQNDQQQHRGTLLSTSN